MSFETINYKGKELERVVSDKTQVAYFSHIYLTGYPPNQNNRKHHCLQRGFWCRQQAIRQPIEVIRYLLRKRRG